MSEVADSRRPGRTAEGRRIAALAVGLQVALAVVLGLFINDKVGETGLTAAPEAVPRALAIPVLYLVPAVIGALGGIAGRRSLLLAAAVSDMVGVILSVATLVFVFAGFIFVLAAAGLGRQRPMPSSLPGFAAGAAIVALIVGSALAVLILTEPVCWIAHQTANGIVYQVVPSIDATSLSVIGDSAGCSSAVLTASGAAVAGILALAAVGVPAVVARRRPDEASTG